MKLTELTSGSIYVKMSVAIIRTDNMSFGNRVIGSNQTDRIVDHMVGVKSAIFKICINLP